MCVEMVWTHGVNGGRLVGEENSRIHCEVERKSRNGMGGQCVKSIE